MISKQCTLGKGRTRKPGNKVRVKTRTAITEKIAGLVKSYAQTNEHLFHSDCVWVRVQNIVPVVIGDRCAWSEVWWVWEWQDVCALGNVVWGSHVCRPWCILGNWVHWLSWPDSLKIQRICYVQGLLFLIEILDLPMSPNVSNKA